MRDCCACLFHCRHESRVVSLITSECRVEAQRSEVSHGTRPGYTNIPMNAVSVTLVATALLSTGMWARLLWQIWILRHAFKIAARAPVLVGVCGWSTLVMLSALFLHWILMVDGKGLPCFVMLFASYLCECTCRTSLAPVCCVPDARRACACFFGHMRALGSHFYVDRASLRS